VFSATTTSKLNWDIREISPAVGARSSRLKTLVTTLYGGNRGQVVGAVQLFYIDEDNAVYGAESALVVSTTE